MLFELERVGPNKVEKHPPKRNELRQRIDNLLR